jgi:hypothetical protein
MDHRVPLEVGGGANDLANLWPEPWEAYRRHPEGIAARGSGAQSKDKIENRTRAAICNRRLSLQQGQQVFLTPRHRRVPHTKGGPSPCRRQCGDSADVCCLT